MHVLVGTAADMFLERGYEALSLDELIARAGGSRRNIYDNFGGKEGLFIEAVTRLCQEMAEPMEALPLENGDLAVTLRSFGTALLTIVLTPRTIALHRLMVAEGQRFPELAQAVWRAGHHRAAIVLASVFDDHRTTFAGWNSDVPSLVLAQQFVSLVVADVQLRALVGLLPAGLSTFESDGLVADAIQLFLTGILKQKGTHNASC
jgi:AcrR family transcriptional regulator